MKKIKILAVVLVFGIIFAGCGSGTQPASSESSVSTGSDKSEPVDKTAAINDTNLEEIQSEMWKQVVWDFAKDYHEERINDLGNGYEDYFDWLAYNISLYIMDSENSIGIKIETQVDPQHGYSNFYVIDNGSLNMVASGNSTTVYYDTDTGDFDFLSVYTSDSGSVYAECFSLYNGNWESEAVYTGYVGGNYDGDISYEQYMEIHDQFKENHEPYESPNNIRIGYQSKANLRAVPWSDVAVEFSEFLDSFDGIKVDLAGKEGYDSVEVDTATTPEWADAYAELVKQLREHEEYSANKSYGRLDIRGFTLMDMYSSGEPNLLIDRWPVDAGGAPPWVEVFDADLARQPLSATVFGDSRKHDILGEPLRYFKHNGTGEIIFSTLYSTMSTNIVYINLNDFSIYRSIGCHSMGSHEHILFDENWNTIETLQAKTKSNDECGIEYGRNAADSTVVSLINKALKDYDEIPTPEKYTYTIDHSGYDTKEVQDWIYEIAADITGVKPVATSASAAWTDTYARLIGKLEKSPHVQPSPSSVFNPDFYLMDVDADGVPELFIDIVYDGRIVYFLDVTRAEQALSKASDSFFNDLPTIVGLPLRFFKINNTGKTIFSSLREEVNFMTSDNREILYTYAQSGERYRSLTCDFSSDTPNLPHKHILFGGVGTVIEEQNSIANRDCDFGLGRNSPDSTLSALARKALEGTTDLPTPELHKYTGAPFVELSPFLADPTYNVKKVQDWVYETAVLY